MRKRLGFIALLAVIVALGASGCAPQFAITTDLAEPLRSPALFRVGSVTDQLPSTVAVKDKPSAEDIGKFRRYLMEELDELKPTIQVVEAEDAAYEVTGEIMKYTKGSGFLRSTFGLGAGTAKALTELSVVEVATGDVIFGGNFEGSVSHWTQGSGDTMFRQVAVNFAKELKKQHAAK